MDHDARLKNRILGDPLDAPRLFAADEAVDVEQARIVPIREEPLNERLSERFQALDGPLLLLGTGWTCQDARLKPKAWSGWIWACPRGQRARRENHHRP
jgi:hypothetical protein